MQKAILLATLIGTAIGMPVLAEAQNVKVDSSDEAGVEQGSEPEALESVVIFGEVIPYFEQSNSTALKGAVERTKVPFTTNTMNAQVIEDLKAERLEEVFEYIPSFSRSNRTANNFTIRGHSADLQNLQVDGLPGLTSRFGSPVTANIEKVEVLKGPASVLYGWMDPGGLVNMITKKPEDDEFTEISLSGEFFPEYGDESGSFSVDTNGRVKKDGSILYRVVAGYQNEDSFRDFVKNEEAWYFFPSLSWVPDAGKRLDVQMEYTEERRAGDSGLFVLNQDIKQRADITTYYQEPGDTLDDFGIALNVSYEDQFRDDMKLNAKWRSVYHEDEKDLYENNFVQADNTLRRRNRHQINVRQYHFGDVNLDIDFDAGFKQKLITGIGGGYELRQFDRLAFDARGANVGLNNPIYTGDILADDPDSFRTFNLYNAGIYAQDQVFLTDKLTLLLGARFDSQWGDLTTVFPDGPTDGEDSEESAFITTQAYNLGGTYEVTNQVALYASMSQSFNPQFIPTFDANNNQLDPEKGIQYEVGAKLSFLDNKLTTNISAYDLTKENVAETVNGVSQLVGTIESYGAEVEVQYQPSLNWQFQGSYAYTHAEVTETTNLDALGNVPGFAPKHTAAVLLRYNYPEEVFDGLVGAGVGARYQSERFTDEETSRRVLLPGYAVADLNFYYELERVKLSLNVENVFDKVYFNGGRNDTEVHAGDPRKVILKAKWFL
ncbi:TonB-dependent receptor [Hwanghaeella grinnelliae]|uniref:TonB-dependent receptor n=1 Tax=Hwanghaeella grinnelliae TaxID=2500179 RepID=A0A437QHB9_9PROT|nr:TonB-dependent receptor [Hwanghaeella grinnelliae]RVU33922.1 TonB-dependent receptor [Hwanghaeella grinnelliae]